MRCCSKTTEKAGRRDPGVGAMEAQRGAPAALGDAVAPRSRDALDQATQAQPPQIVGRATGLPTGGLVAPATARRASAAGGSLGLLGFRGRLRVRQVVRHVYRMVRDGQDYVDIGAKAYEERFRQRAVTSLQARVRSLGYTVVPWAPSGQPASLAQPA